MADLVKRGEHPMMTGWDPIRSMREMLRWDSMLREPFFREPMAWLSRADRDMWAPMFEVRENGSAIKLVGDLPGVRRDDLEITVSGNLLTISGHREAEEQTKGEQFHAYERSFGQFTRTFTLPDYADIDHITSSLSEGVLTVVVPKSGQSKSRKIAIGGASPKS
jgi:HSP20 family protein